jgi:hypothetical protein
MLIAGCSSPPVRIVSQTNDQVSVCRDTVEAEAQDAENMAAKFCAARGLLPRLAAVERCSRRALRYDYFCTGPRY